MQPGKHQVNEYFIVDYKIKISEPTTKIFNSTSEFLLKVKKNIQNPNGLSPSSSFEEESGVMPTSQI